MRVQMSVARLLWFGTFRIREHVKYDGFLSYSHRELDEWFGRRKFKAINDRLDLFDITHWSWVGKFTKAYRMTAHTALTLERYFARRREQTTAMLFGDGAELKTIPAAIASKDARGRTTTAWPEAEGLRLVPVNLEQMKVLREWLKLELKDGEARLGLFTGTMHRARLERLLDDVRHLIRLAQTKPAGYGQVAHRYVQSSSGRLYAKGWNLQNAGKVVTHRQLLREVWGPIVEKQGLSHYLRVYVAELRRKLEADPTRPRLLLTEPAVGYRLLDELPPAG